MLPDYIIFDELRRRKELDDVDGHRPQLEIPLYIPYGPEKERDEELDEKERETGVIIMQM